MSVRSTNYDYDRKSREQIQIKCPAKPITHAFVQFIDNDERDKFVRSANIFKKELRGRKIRISPAMDAEERFHQKRVGYFKCCTHARHNVPLVQIKMTRQVSVDGQMEIRTCAYRSLKYHIHQDIEVDVEEIMEKWLTKNSSQYLGIRRRMEGMTMCNQDETPIHKEQGDEWLKGKGEGDRVSDTLTVTFQCACVTKAKMMN